MHEAHGCTQLAPFPPRISKRYLEGKEGGSMGTNGETTKVHAEGRFFGFGVVGFDLLSVLHSLVCLA